MEKKSKTENTEEVIADEEASKAAKVHLKRMLEKQSE